MPGYRWPTACLLLFLVTSSPTSGMNNSQVGPPRGTVPIDNPEPIRISADSTTNVRRIIAEALAGRGWVITRDDPGSLDATVMSRGHTAKIQVSYDLQSITIRYLDSANLRYWRSPGGAEYIHSSYNRWIRLLVEDMTALSVHLVGRRPPVVQPVRSVSSAGGFLIAPTIVATSFRTIEGHRAVRCQVGSETIEARLLSHDARNDLALLRLDRAPKDAVVLHLGSGLDARQGQRVFALTFPSRQDLGKDLRAHTGIVSSLVGYQGSAGELQLEMSVPPGSIGGPVLNASGSVLAIMTGTPGGGYTTGQGSVPDGVTFAVNVEYLRLLAKMAGIEDQLEGTPSAKELTLEDVVRNSGPAIVRVEPEK